MPVNAPDMTPPSLDEDDAPPWSDDAFARAEISAGGKLLQSASGALMSRGRPPSDRPKRQVTLRLDAEVLDYFRSGGPGWQGRINAALKKAAAG